MWQIKKNLFESILIAAKSNYPNEFLALLGGKRNEKLLEELVVIPAVYGKDFSFLQSNLIPVDFSILGSVHSHPSYSFKASSEDLISFPRMGEVHLIIAQPFNDSSFALYDSKGHVLQTKII